VDALGLIVAVVVTAASVTDNAIGIRLLDKVAEHAPTVTHAWVDAASSRTSPFTARFWTSTSRSSNAPTPCPGSYRSRSGGSSSRHSAR
jgi:hypothetical protein